MNAEWNFVSLNFINQLNLWIEYHYLKCKVKNLCSSWGNSWTKKALMSIFCLGLMNTKANIYALVTNGLHLFLASQDLMLLHSFPKTKLCFGQMEDIFSKQKISFFKDGNLEKCYRVRKSGLNIYHKHTLKELKLKLMAVWLQQAPLKIEKSFFKLKGMLLILLKLTLWMKCGQIGLLQVQPIFSSMKVGLVKAYLRK